MGKAFTVADAYLFVLLGWTKPTGIDLAQVAEPRRVPQARRRAAQGAGSDAGRGPAEEGGMSGAAERLHLPRLADARPAARARPARRGRRSAGASRGRARSSSRRRTGKPICRCSPARRSRRRSTISTIFPSRSTACATRRRARPSSRSALRRCCKRGRLQRLDRRHPRARSRRVVAAALHVSRGGHPRGADLGAARARTAPSRRSSVKHCARSQRKACSSSARAT